MRFSWQPFIRELRRRKPERAFRMFLPYVARQRSLLVGALIFSFLQAAMTLVRPWPLKLIFDYVLLNRTHRDHGFLGRLVQDKSHGFIIGMALGVFLASILLEGFFGYRHIVLVATAGQRVVFAIRRKLFAHIQRLSLTFHDRRPSGELVTNLTGDVNLLREMLLDSIMIATSQGLIIFGMIAVMMWMDLPLTLVAIAVLPALTVVTFRFSGSIRKAVRRQRVNEGFIASAVSEAVRAIRVIQSFGRWERHDEDFAEQNKGSMKYGLKAKRLEANLGRSVEFIVGLGVCAVLGIGAFRAKRGLLTPGDLIVFMSYLNSFYRPLRRLSRLAARLSKAAACADRVVEVLAVNDGIRSKSNAVKPNKLRGEIAFERVRFDYEPQRQALDKVSFSVRPGQFIGLVGPSGAGKSSVLSLLLRLYDPQEGKIRIDGLNLKNYDVEALRLRFGVVLSEPVLFRATIAENIAYGKEGATQDEIQLSAQRANAHEFIMGLPKGYKTMVGETGTTLSAGQRQRIAIARTFIKGFDILLMDEPLAGLDAIATGEVKQALGPLREGCTTILASHHLVEVARADEVFVLFRGRILARGTHEELYETCRWYRRVYKFQRGHQEKKNLYRMDRGAGAK